MKVIKHGSALEGAPAFDTAHTIKAVDPELWRAIERENRRQHDHIELIASENYVSPAVMQAQGSQLTNKYAEGYPGRRYYGGCEFVDIVEQLAIDRVVAIHRRRRVVAFGLLQVDEERVVPPVGCRRQALP